MRAVQACFSTSWRCVLRPGIPEALGLLEQAGPSLAGELEARLAEFVYHEAAFILPPWESIFVQDEERDQTFADTLRVHESLCRWYVRCGFRLIEVPRAAVGERAEFVLRQVGSRGSEPEKVEGRRQARCR